MYRGHQQTDTGHIMVCAIPMTRQSRGKSAFIDKSLQRVMNSLALLKRLAVMLARSNPEMRLCQSFLLFGEAPTTKFKFRILIPLFLEVSSAGFVLGV